MILFDFFLRFSWILWNGLNLAKIKALFWNSVEMKKNEPSSEYILDLLQEKFSIIQISLGFWHYAYIGEYRIGKAG